MNRSGRGGERDPRFVLLDERLDVHYWTGEVERGAGGGTDHSGSVDEATHGHGGAEGGVGRLLVGSGGEET